MQFAGDVSLKIIAQEENLDQADNSVPTITFGRIKTEVEVAINGHDIYIAAGPNNTAFFDDDDVAVDGPLPLLEPSPTCAMLTSTCNCRSSNSSYCSCMAAMSSVRPFYLYYLGTCFSDPRCWWNALFVQARTRNMTLRGCTDPPCCCCHYYYCCCCCCCCPRTRPVPS